jgi:hypothetical protein
MTAKNFLEPLLEFGKGTDLCPKRGIRIHQPYDIDQVRPSSIRLGIIGKSDSVDKIVDWLKGCQDIIEAKASKQPKLFPSFPGFNENTAFCSKLVYDEGYKRKLNNSEFDEIAKRCETEADYIDSMVELYIGEIKFLSKNKRPDVILCVLSEKFVQMFNPNTNEQIEDELNEEGDDVMAEENEDEIPQKIEQNFRRLLKARAMKYHVPIQIVRDRIDTPTGEMQDPASIAWNIFTALYYKASGTPWRLVKDTSTIVCYAGISFYRSRDRATMQTSIAQIFNEIGKGVILRGEEPIHTKKDDPVPHLSEEQAFKLMDKALAEYREALRILPQRLVVHKTSNFNEGEYQGIVSAAKRNGIDALDLVTIHERSNLRIFREHSYPPLRGTLLSFDEKNHLLYTKGSVPYYETSTSKYIPNPLQIRIFRYDESPDVIFQEILGLTKMNWNNTQFDRRLPITLECARRVGDILKYLPDDEEMELRYSFYM